MLIGNWAREHIILPVVSCSALLTVRATYTEILGMLDQFRRHIEAPLRLVLANVEDGSGVVNPFGVIHAAGVYWDES